MLFRNDCVRVITDRKDRPVKSLICEEENIAMSNLNSQERETLVRILTKIKYNILLESENTEDIY